MLVSGNTLQIPDYSKTDWQWTLFDPEAKKKRHEEVFPQECRKAFEMGAALLQIDKCTIYGIRGTDVSSAARAAKTAICTSLMT